MRESMWVIVALKKGGRTDYIVIRSEQENEKMTRTVPILKSNSILFNYFFFSTMDISIFPDRGRGVDWEGEFYFLSLYFLLFHQCNNINITYQQFCCCLPWYLTHSYSLLCFDVFPPPPWKLHFWPLKMHLLPQFLT